jgi:hypothetical protein
VKVDRAALPTSVLFQYASPEPSDAFSVSRNWHPNHSPRLESSFSAEEKSLSDLFDVPFVLIVLHRPDNVASHVFAKIGSTPPRPWIEVHDAAELADIC